MRVRMLVAFLLAGAVALSSAPAAAQGDTTAIAINTRDGADVFRLAFAVRRVLRDVVDQSNVAVAYASCTDCQTVAISLQAVLVFSDPDVVTPENLALAVNQGCDTCETLATAYQFVLGTDGVARFTAEGSRRLAEIRRQLLALRHADLSVEEIQAEVDALAAEFEQVLRTELVPVGPPRTSPAPSPSATDASSPSPSPSPSGSASASPSSSPTSSGDDAEASPSPTSTTSEPSDTSTSPSPEATGGTASEEPSP